MSAVLEDMLTDAQVAARLNLEIRQFQSALRRLIPPPPPDPTELFVPASRVDEAA
jgi:hypothetical protein